MIKGIGIDIVELERIKKNLEERERFPDRILTEREKARFLKLTNTRRKVEFLAGRFAAKEACAKALGTGIGRLSFHHIEILNNPDGAPVMHVTEYEDCTFMLSISHSRDYAVAQVLVQKI